MADVKPLVINATGQIKEYSSSDAMLVPLLVVHPTSTPPVGYVYLYALTADKDMYQKDSDSVTTNLTASGGGGGLSYRQVRRLQTIHNNR
jgi:hypothetical protein